MKEKIETINRIILDKDKVNFNFYSETQELLFSVEKSLIFELLSNINFLINDDDKEMRARALERIQKLRNLHLNLNRYDFSEFENVPAYVRLNMDLNVGNSELYSETTLPVFEVNLQENEELYDHKEQVYIYLPAEEIPLLLTEDLTTACGEFMEALGYELEHENEPIYGSFLQNMWFKIKSGTKATKDEIAEDFGKGKKALELKYVELPTAEQTEKLANSALKIVELLKEQDEGVVRLGALLVLKKSVDGKSKVIIQQLNYDLINILDKSPQLLQNLQTVYELITGDVKVIKDTNENEQLKLLNK